MRGIAWRLYLGTGALATGAYYLLPEAGGAVLNVVVGASAVAAMAGGDLTRSTTRPCRILPMRCSSPKEWEWEMQALVIVFAILVVLAVVAGRYGADSRDGFDRSAPSRPGGRGLW